MTRATRRFLNLNPFESNFTSKFSDSMPPKKKGDDEESKVQVRAAVPPAPTVRCVLGCAQC